MGAYAELQSLVQLQSSARGFSLRPRQHVHSLISGRHASRMRGRGLDFEELRAYVLGDDIRTLDWRVTARLRKPFVRVFTEERDRPVLLMIDQRINMFFGTRLSTKSVTAAEIAALCAWRAYGQGDRVGALVFNDSRVEEFKPSRSRSATMRILDAVARQNQMLNAASLEPANPGQLQEALQRICRTAQHDFTIFLISDFDGVDAGTTDLLLELSRSNDVMAFFVRDPFDHDLPTAGELVAGDGELQVELQFSRGGIRDRLINASRRRIANVLAWQEKLQIPVLSVNTAEESARQVRQLLGHVGSRRSRI